MKNCVITLGTAKKGNGRSLKHVLMN